MKLLVGLGNIGEKYARTRHNIGFLVVDELANQLAFGPWKGEKKFRGQLAIGEIHGEKTILLKPDTYMNLSGESIRAVAHFYKIPLQKIGVFFDDIDLSFGEVRWRGKGGSGGHNGIKSLIKHLGSQEFSRLKFGISNEYRAKTPTDQFVLGKFTPDEQDSLPAFIEKGIQVFLEQKL